MNAFSREDLIGMSGPAKLVTLALTVLIGCAPAGVVLVDKPMVPPPSVACCVAVGHDPDNVPFILGGECFCTPSHRLVEEMHGAGKHLDVDYAKLVQMYKAAGITTDLDHRGCNNLCENGPHVAFGGKCMATPTPGTKNYERVISMIRATPVSSEQ
ncbi:MAG: hypothetical protein JSW58_03810 [Candidatus Latescibacterota bacterium]|nr:MAG: hypothetical protein JSW58_03810 [Candidatus Latescibacterota bacterium]